MVSWRWMFIGAMMRPGIGWALDSGKVRAYAYVMSLVISALRRSGFEFASLWLPNWRASWGSMTRSSSLRLRNGYWKPYMSRSSGDLNSDP